MTQEKFELHITHKQRDFIAATADEVLFGGAAGGGKSVGQLVDALVYAVRWPGSRQLILRRTLPELERTLVRASLAMYPAQLYSYSAAHHCGRFANGSLLDFGYCDSENDVYRYQSAEYDVIRFDELTHFSAHMYTYLRSRLRGANRFPKQMKSTTNPGGVGHVWVKERFIDPMPPRTLKSFAGGSRIFIPALVSDNGFLTGCDPDYVRRLGELGEGERRALLEGRWDIAEGRYFDEWDESVHVCRPFAIPAHWQRYFAMDYGLDMLAGYFFAVDTQERVWVYREIYESDLIISAAAAKIAAAGETVREYIAPPDLWSRRQDSGRSAAEIFALAGMPLSKAGADRVAGWLALKEKLKITRDETGQKSAGLVFFDCCRNAIRCLPALLRDPNDPSDTLRQPHELTHAPDAVRYFVNYRFAGGEPDTCVSDEQLARLMNYGI